MWSWMRKLSNPFHGNGKWRGVVLASLALILIIFTLNSKENPTPPSGLLKQKWDSGFQSSVQFHPSLELLNGTDLIWQIPETPKAALFIAHGCGVRASMFWDNYPGCPNCTGLPEERLFVLRALERKFAVLTASSLDRCWSFGKEMENIKWIIEWWSKSNKLEKLPIVAFGASSGGYFISALATKMNFSSIVIMIAEGVFDAMSIPKNYTPTLFVHMPKDRERMRLILTNMENLRLNGVPTKEIRCMEFPLTPEIFSDRIPGVNRSVSVKLYDLLRENGFIDSHGYMKNDGRSTNWKQALENSNILPENSQLLRHIEEEMNLAFAYHEMTSLPTDDMLDWFESHMN